MEARKRKELSEALPQAEEGPESRTGRGRGDIIPEEPARPVSVPPTPPPLYAHLGTGSPVCEGEWEKEENARRGLLGVRSWAVLWPFLDTRAPDGSGSHFCLSLTPFFMLFTEVVSYFYILLQFPSSHSYRGSRN